MINKPRINSKEIWLFKKKGDSHFYVLYFYEINFSIEIKIIGIETVIRSTINYNVDYFQI